MIQISYHKAFLLCTLILGCELIVWGTLAIIYTEYQLGPICFNNNITFIRACNTSQDDNLYINYKQSNILALNTYVIICVLVTIIALFYIGWIWYNEHHTILSEQILQFNDSEHEFVLYNDNDDSL